jgi:hypothetical protein
MAILGVVQDSQITPREVIYESAPAAKPEFESSAALTAPLHSDDGTELRLGLSTDPGRIV